MLAVEAGMHCVLSGNSRTRMDRLAANKPISSVGDNNQIRQFPTDAGIAEGRGDAPRPPAAEMTADR